jgi:Lar family restriction alleviation protein
VTDHKPCPFCGSLNLETTGDDNNDWITCEACGAEGPVAYNLTEAWRLWDERYVREKES